MYTVYLLKSVNFLKSYVGMTNNLSRRLEQHNKGLHRYTKRYAPWKVIYTENYDTLSEARKREEYFKSAAGKRYIKKEIFK